MTKEGRFPPRVAVVGFGRTGRAVIRFLRAVSPTTNLLVSESGMLSDADREELRNLGVQFEQEQHRASFLRSANLVILSPGVCPTIQPLRRIRELGVPVISELDLAAMTVDPDRIVAVTGTNGKTSTVELISRLLQRAGYNAVTAGNIGTPVVELLIPPARPAIFVVEASSFQLEQSVRFHPHVAVWLNLTPDHLTRHGSMAAYAEAKKRIFAHQRTGDFRIVPPELTGGINQTGIHVELFQAARIPGAGTWPWIAKLPQHMRHNLAAAVTACHAVDPEFQVANADESIVRAVTKLPYRMQALPPIDGVDVINDSKSTNAGSTIAAAATVIRPVVVMLGGREKRGGYDELFTQLRARGDALRELVLFGEAGPAFAEMSAAAGIAPSRLTLADSLPDAVAAALVAAQAGDVILFSPGCSSFDHFRDYLHRGDEFTKLIDDRRGTVPH